MSLAALRLFAACLCCARFVRGVLCLMCVCFECSAFWCVDLSGLLCGVNIVCLFVLACFVRIVRWRFLLAILRGCLCACVVVLCCLLLLPCLVWLCWFLFVCFVVCVCCVFDCCVCLFVCCLCCLFVVVVYC